MDELDRLTDAELEKLEKKIEKLYKEASAELTQIITDYFAKFQGRDAAMRELLENGEIDEQKYRNWRLAQIGRGKRFEALRDELAERMVKADEVAMAYVNDVTPGVYSLNMNYMAYNIEKSYGNIGFTVWNDEAVRLLAMEEPDLMPYYPEKKAVARGIDLAYGQRQITAQVTSSIMLGDSMPKIADKLQNRIETMSRVSAVRAARTAITAAQNGGRQATFERAAAMGIKVRRRWIATKDLRTRPEHGHADGQIVAVDEPFTVGGEKLMFPGDRRTASGWNIYNCRCSIGSVEKEGIEAESTQIRVRNPVTGRNELVNEMTYDEWYKNKVANSNAHSIIDLEDIIVGKSVGAKAKSYNITLPNKEVVHLTEGTRITHVQVIAGKGRNRKIDVVDGLLAKYPGTVEGEWQKVKGIGYIDFEGESYKADLHWYQEPSVGRVEWKVKPNADGNWFIEDD